MEDINPSVKVHSQNRVATNKVQNKVKGHNQNSKKVPQNYVWIRSGTRNKHFANECLAIKLK